ncbi:hypothetical protein PLESTB_000879500 [Pleodorina starrii]|uniref:Uncharacterized protein n=1 Tax=Pleodorina starrii TaxID=330485 RepID=A0A9W6BM57_9CHLO|nr:hypothetical protein PLESTB_000879500 [Pleodorina starrii]
MDISAVAASALATKNGVLSTLEDLARADPEDEDAKAFIETFGWVKGAWEAAVKKRGMSLPDYEAVRAFKQKSNNSFHDADPSRDASRVLESPAPVPEEMQQYREPLKALLKALTMKQ